MQVCKFSDGGYAVHKIVLSGYAGRFSAWYDENGALVGAEQFDRLNRARPVDGRHIRPLLAKIGRFVKGCK